MVSHGMRELAIRDPYKLVQSTDVSEARVKFFEKNGIELTPTHIFLPNGKFQKRYKIDKETLLEKYGPKKDTKEDKWTV